MYSDAHSSLSPVSTIPAQRAGIKTLSVQMATSGVANWFQRHGLQISLSIATYIIPSGMSVFGASVQRTNLEIMSLLTSNTHGGITTYNEQSAMPATNQRIPNSTHTMFTEDSRYFDIFPAS
jgi:hypothetical protein